MSLKIAFITLEWPFDKTRHAFLNNALAHSLAQQGLQVEVITRASENVTASTRSSGLNVHKLIQKKFLQDTQLLGQALLQMRPKVVHLHITRPVSAATMAFYMSAFAAAQFIKAPVVLSVSQEAMFQRFSSKILLPLFVQAAAVYAPVSTPVPNTRFFQSSLYDVAPPESDTVEHPLLGEDLVDKHYIGLYSSMTERPLFLKSVAQALVPLLQKNLHFQVLGLMSFDAGPAVYRHSFRNFIQELGLSERFHFAGTDDFLLQRRLLMACDAVIFADERSFGRNFPWQAGCALHLGKNALWNLTPEEEANLAEHGLHSHKHFEMLPFQKDPTVLEIALSELDLQRSVTPPWACSLDALSNDLSRLYSQL